MHLQKGSYVYVKEWPVDLNVCNKNKGKNLTAGYHSNTNFFLVAGWNDRKHATKTFFDFCQKLSNFIRNTYLNNNYNSNKIVKVI